MAREHIIANSIEDLNEIASQFGSSWSPAVARAYDMPMPLPGEAVSSWLVRYAILRDCSPAKILDRIGVTWKKPVYWLDVDGKALPWDYLGKLACTSPHLLKQRVPDQLELLLSPELLCLHTDPMRMQPHLRYCENCLTSDPIPYYRTTWRLSSTWICLNHGSVLRDYCPICRAPVYWDVRARGRINISDLRMCHHCGGDLCSVQESVYLPTWLTAEVTAIQLEFAYLLGMLEADDQSHPAPAVIPVESDAISNTAQAATLSMQESLQVLYARQPSPTMTQAFERLKQVVRVLDFSPLSNFPGLHIGVGIEAKALFGRTSAQMCRFVMEHQNLFGTTLWWPGEKLFKNPLQHEWEAKDFDRTKNWALHICGANSFPPSLSLPRVQSL